MVQQTYAHKIINQGQMHDGAIGFGLANVNLEIDYFRFEEEIEIRKISSYYVCPIMYHGEKIWLSSSNSPEEPFVGGKVVHLNAEFIISRSMASFPTKTENGYFSRWLIRFLKCLTPTNFDVLFVNNGTFTTSTNVYPESGSCFDLQDKPRFNDPITREKLEWISDYWRAAYTLYTENNQFENSFNVLDYAMKIDDPVIGARMIWDTILHQFSDENGQHKIEDSIADYLEPPGESRKDSKELVYNIRKSFESDDKPSRFFEDIFMLNRKILQVMIERQKVIM